MERLYCALIGAAFGNIITAEIISRLHAGRSIRHMGSGNPGTANSLATMGKKAGLLVLAGDLLKTFAACLLCRLVFFPQLGADAALYAGLGVLIGHIFPVWLRFRGGRGVASLCALAAAFDPWIGIAASLIGLAVVLITKYLALGTAAIAVSFAAAGAVVHPGTERLVLFIVIALLCVLRSTDSYMRIIRGTEKKTMLLKKKNN